MKVSIVKFIKRRDGFKEIFSRMKQKECERKQVLVVPEKFGVNAERAMFEELDCGATFFMDITTFDRLADEYVINRNLQYLSKSAGVMLVQKIAQDNLKELNVLSRSSSFNGFCENMFNTIMLLKSSMVSPQELENASEILQDVSKLKLQDIKKIYQIYEDTLKDRYIDSSNKMDQLAKQLVVDDDVKNVDYYIYSPKLTKQVLNVCSSLVKKANSVTFMLDDYVLDSTINDENYTLLTQMLKQQGVKFEVESINKSILSEQLKSIGTIGKFKNMDIKFYSYKNIAEEVESVCREIVSGGRFKDSTILVCDLNKYKSTLERTLQDFNISYFIDTQISLLETAPIKFLSNLISLTYEFKIEKVLALAKSNYFDFEELKVYNFETYLKRWGINERNYFSDNKPNDDLYADFFEIYTNFNNIFKDFKEKMQQSQTYQNMINVLREFIVNFDFAEKITKECENLVNLKEYQRAKQCEQVLNKIENVFKQLEDILGLNKTSIKDFHIVLKAGLDSVMVKTPPLMVDNVYVGDMNNAMLYDCKNLYVLGAVENAFPVYNQDCGLILDKELNTMRPIASIDPSIRKVNQENTCNLINNLCCCSNLQLSYPVSIFFVEQQPSTLLQTLATKFSSKFLQKENFTILDNANDFAKTVANSKRAESIIRKIAVVKDDNSDVALKRVNSISKSLNIDLSNAVATPTIKRQLTNSSVSQLQVYFECPFKNFAKYGLKMKENIDNTLKPVDVGNFMHKVAELFGLYLIKAKVNFVDDESIFDKICNTALDLFELNANGKKGKILDAKQKTIISNLVNSSKLMLRAINQQNKMTDFKIEAVEKDINLKINNGKFDTFIKGKIDRVDTFGNFVRIIDYKTGSETFKESELKCGRRIQLFIYLGALQKLEKKQPIGAYYFKIKDDFSKPYSDKDYLKTYCLNGATINDIEIILSQDKTLNEENTSSNIIPINLSYSKGDCKVDGRRKGAYSGEKLQEMIDYAENIFKLGTLEIADGNIEKAPLEKICDYCEFKGVLCFGAKNCRKLKKEKEKDKK